MNARILNAQVSAAKAAQHLQVTAALFLCLIWCDTASALSKDGYIRDLQHTTWGAEEGAPLIVSLAQTREGYLWLASPGGVFRFDGLRFEHANLARDPRLSSLNAYCVYAPPTGGLWIGFTFGGAAFLKDGHTTVYGESDGLPPGSVKAFAQSSDGTVWAGTSSGLARLEGSRFRKIGADYHYSELQTLALTTDSADNLWALSNNRVLLLRRGEKQFEVATTIRPDRNSFGIAESPTGVVWFSDGRELRQLRKNGASSGRSAKTGRSIAFDRDGSLWIILENGGVRRIVNPADYADRTDIDLNQPMDSYSAGENPPNQSGTAGVLEDREGNMWFSNGNSLERFSERKVTRVELFGRDPATRFGAYNAALAAADRGGLWVGDRASDLLSIDDDTLRHHEDLRNISCAIRADDGTVWFASNKAIWKYTSGRFDRVALPAGSDDFDVQAMAQDRSGDLWVSIVRRGVFRFASGVWKPFGGLESLPKLTAISIATDWMGRLWFGYTEGRVALVDGNGVSVYEDARHLSVGNVAAIYGKRSKVWAAGEFGLARWDGAGFKTLEAEGASTFSNITGVIETANGDLWLNSSAGIVHVTAGETHRANEDSSYKVHAEIFDSREGVQGDSARLRPMPTAVDGTDGRLWFARNIGIYSISPGRILRNVVPPPVLIQSLNAEEKSYVPVADLLLPQHTTSIRIDYVGLSLTKAEKVRYRYKLDGADADWQQAEGRRQAFYTNLAAGPHRFHVLAANNDGVWNETGATLDFVIAPTFFQTRWFIALCIVGGLGVVSVLFWVRVRQVAARLRGRAQERLDERERIARELHDTLLQSTQGLILRFQSVANRIPAQDPTRELLNKALNRADEVLAEGRDRVLDLRVPAETLNDLPKALAAAGEELALGRSVSFRTVVEGEPRKLERLVNDEAYRIGREALLNAFQHAEATSIEVQIIFSGTDFRVRVRDNGRGLGTDMVEPRSRPGHWGMTGMRERAQRIGAKLDVWSKDGAGTEIELRVTASIAYEDRRLRWWRRRSTPDIKS